MTKSKLFNAVYGVHINGSIMGTHEQEIIARNKKSAEIKANRIALLLQRIDKINNPKADYWYRLEELYECGKEVKRTLSQYAFNERCHEVFSCERNEEVYSSDEEFLSIEMEGDDVKILLSVPSESGRLQYHYYPDMSDRPQALAYLLGERDDFND